jgi:hypothetical protein
MVTKSQDHSLAVLPAGRVREAGREGDAGVPQ